MAQNNPFAPDDKTLAAPQAVGRAALRASLARTATPVAPKSFSLTVQKALKEGNRP